MRHGWYGNVLWADGHASAQYARGRNTDDTPERWWRDFYTSTSVNPAALGALTGPSTPAANKWDRE